MTDYSKMSDVDIAVRVGKHVSKDGQALVGINGKACIHEYHPPVGGFGEMCLGWVTFDPCNSWADAGPIIQNAKIGIKPVSRVRNYNERYESWEASVNKPHFEEEFENPLRAAMIVFLMMNEGE